MSKEPTDASSRSESSAARQVAVEVLQEVTEQDAYANLVLPRRLRTAELTGRDAAFATELTYGTLRRQGSYDAIWAACAGRPAERVDVRVRELLRLGAHQLFFMAVPSHAAVSTTVELAKRNGRRSAAGFVNAVLRRMAESTWDEWMAHLTTGMPPGSDADLALRHSHPEWLVAEFSRALVADARAATDVGDLLAADNEPGQVTLAARPPRSTVAELVAAGAHPGLWAPQAAILDSGDPAKVPAVRERRAGVQDEGSQVVAAALALVPLEGDRPERWLDMCAGPGGKAALLASLAEASGARLDAWELHEHRARLVRQQVPSSTTVEVHDAADPVVVGEHAGRFDRVLLDAPCSGAGALRRRPEARWRKSPEDVPRLAASQGRLLEAALTLVRPGGVVAYVTCSPLLPETRDIVDAVPSDAASPVAASAFLPPGLVTGPGPLAQLWPHVHSTDAMFLALLQRTTPPVG